MNRETLIQYCFVVLDIESAQQAFHSEARAQEIRNDNFFPRREKTLIGYIEYYLLI